MLKIILLSDWDIDMIRGVMVFHANLSWDPIVLAEGKELETMSNEVLRELVQRSIEKRIS